MFRTKLAEFLGPEAMEWRNSYSLLTQPPSSKKKLPTPPATPLVSAKPLVAEVSDITTIATAAAQSITTAAAVPANPVTAERTEITAQAAQPTAAAAAASASPFTTKVLDALVATVVAQPTAATAVASASPVVAEVSDITAVATVVAQPTAATAAVPADPVIAERTEITAQAEQPTAAAAAASASPCTTKALDAPVATVVAQPTAMAAAASASPVVAEVIDPMAFATAAAQPTAMAAAATTRMEAFKLKLSPIITEEITTVAAVVDPANPVITEEITPVESQAAPSTATLAAVAQQPAPTSPDVSHSANRTSNSGRSVITVASLIVIVILAILFMQGLSSDTRVSNRRGHFAPPSRVAIGDARFAPVFIQTHPDRPLPPPALPSVDAASIRHLTGRDPWDSEVIAIRGKVNRDLSRISGVFNQLVAVVGGQEAYDALPCVPRQKMMFGHVNPIFGLGDTPANIYRLETLNGTPGLGFRYRNLTNGDLLRNAFFYEGPDGDWRVMDYPHPGSRHVRTHIADFAMMRLGFEEYEFGFGNHRIGSFRLES